MDKNKNKNVSATAAAESSESREIENLKTLNNQLVNEIAENRKQIQLLRSGMASLAVDQDKQSSLGKAAASSNAEMTPLMKNADSARDVVEIALSSSLGEAAACSNAENAESACDVVGIALSTHGEAANAENEAAACSNAKNAESARDVVGIVLSSSLGEAAACSNAEITALMKNAESAVELNAVEMPLLALNRFREKDILEERDSSLRSLEQPTKPADPKRGGGRIWKKWWIYPIASLCVVAVVVTLSSSKGFSLKN